MSASPLTYRGDIVKKAPERTPVRLTAVGLALLCVLAGCNKSGGEEAPSSSAPASGTSSGTTTTEAAAPADYGALLITADDIDRSPPFKAEAPALNPHGEIGATRRFFSEDDAMIGVSVRVLADPAEAARVLELTRENISNVWGTPEPSPIGTNGSIIVGTSVDQITDITMLTFSEQNAVVTLEFDGPYGQLIALPPELIDSVSRRQLAILKAKLPEFVPPAPLPVALTVGGKPVDIRGPVVCKDRYGRSSITAGNSVVRVVIDLEQDASVVHDVYLGNVDGVEMASHDVPATATKDGNTYTISGTASGATDAKPPEQVTKPFEISVTCP